MAKENSIRAIPSIAPIQIGPWSHPETVYANPDGGSFLKSVHTMEMNIEKLIAKTEALDQKSKALEQRSIDQELELIFLESKASSNIGNLSTISEGNKIAHEGDVVTDICLLRNGMISYPDTFCRLYGLHWEEADSLLLFPHMVKAMNCRATRIANGGAEEDLRDEFNELVLWTKNATSDDIAIFNADSTGSTYHKRIFICLTKKAPRRRH
ncbi:hypothetical protein HOY82DRAFT_649285 [Tuber indicum]|nr:hypothetical protein HOY82DRAFT_649285 [Tuber indicum]